MKIAALLFMLLALAPCARAQTAVDLQRHLTSLDGEIASLQQRVSILENKVKGNSPATLNQSEASPDNAVPIMPARRQPLPSRK